MTDLTALVQLIPAPRPGPGEPPPAARPRGAREVHVQAVGADGIGWGAAVRSLAAGSLGLLLCYPFKPGTLLAVRLEGTRARRTVLARVVSAAEQGEGSWLVGCELTSALSEEELHSLL